MSKKKLSNPMLKSWNEYVEHVYPHVEMSERQHNECQQAYYAGYVDSLSTTLDLFDYPADKAKEILRGRIDWLMHYHTNRADALDEAPDKGEFPE